MPLPGKDSAKEAQGSLQACSDAIYKHAHAVQNMVDLLRNDLSAHATEISDRVDLLHEAAMYLSSAGLEIARGGDRIAMCIDHVALALQQGICVVAAGMLTATAGLFGWQYLLLGCVLLWLSGFTVASGRMTSKSSRSAPHTSSRQVKTRVNGNSSTSPWPPGPGTPPSAATPPDATSANGISNVEVPPLIGNGSSVADEISQNTAAIAKDIEGISETLQHQRHHLSTSRGCGSVADGRLRAPQRKPRLVESRHHQPTMYAHRCQPFYNGTIDGVFVNHGSAAAGRVPQPVEHNAGDIRPIN